MIPDLDITYHGFGERKSYKTLIKWMMMMIIKLLLLISIQPLLIYSWLISSATYIVLTKLNNYKKGRELKMKLTVSSCMGQYDMI